VISEQLSNGHHWLRICDADWRDPTDDSFAQRRGGRWNPPDSWRTLYVNEDLVTARLNLEAFIADWPYEPEDLRPDSGPHLAVVTLPRDQAVADVHSPAGVGAVGLPRTYPLDCRKRLVPHDVCRRIGTQVADAGLRGVRCRSARAPHGAGREVAWFPATARSHARLVERLPFDDWFWS
jgi:hypothetical protein